MIKDKTPEEEQEEAEFKGEVQRDMEIDIKIVRGLINSLEDIKKGRYIVLTN